MGRKQRKSTQTSRGRAFWAWKPLAGAGAVLALLLLTPGVVRAKETLVPAQVNQLRRTDQRGFNWDPNVQGIINDGTSDCFDNALALKVNSGHFTPNKPPMQTKDGQEFIFRGTVGQIEVTRRLRLDPVVGAMRYVEILKNTSRRAVRVTVETSSMLGSNASGVQTNLGRSSLLSGQLQKGETALFAIRNGGSRPSVIFQLRGPRSKNVPIVNIANNRTFTVTWNVNIPAGRSAAILHSVAQRRWTSAPAAKAMEAELKPMLDPKWAHGLPGAVRSILVNHGGAGAGSGSLTEAAPAHAEVLALAKAYQVERGEEAVVFLDREKPLTGSAEGAEVQVNTRMGEVSVPFDDVAVVVGGAGLGRSMRLYLRDGEVLAGHVTAAGLRFKTKSGLEIPLEPEGLDALFLPKQKRDGVVAKDTDAFLTQLDGTKLALKKSAGLVLHAVSPWGDLEIPLEEAIRIRYTREPLPGLWILLQDGSRFPLAVRGAALRLTSRRFGDVDVVPGSIAAWTRHAVVARVVKGEDEDEALPTATHAQFLGGCFLAGAFLDETFTVETVAGATSVQVEQIGSIERSDDGEGSSPTFLFKLKTGDSIEGRIRQPLFRWKTPRGTCHVPTLHLWGYRWTPEPKADPKPDKDPTGDAGKDTPGKDTPGKDTSGKDTPGKGAAGKGAAGKGAAGKDAPEPDKPTSKEAGKKAAAKKSAAKKAPADDAPPKGAPAKESK